jgi:hypothetical protein
VGPDALIATLSQALAPNVRKDTRLHMTLPHTLVLLSNLHANLYVGLDA